MQDITEEACMNRKNTPTRYGSLSIGLHWLMLLLIAAVYACIELKGNFPKGSETRELLKQWHFMLGLAVFALVWLRLLARALSPAPAIEPAPPGWQHLLAKLMHLALYALMIAAPLAGWLILSAAGKPIPFFGLELPALIGQNKDLAGQVKELHELAGTAGYWLIGLHALAGLYHHYVVRDNTLKRMLPGRN
jgi:cytochrome b561